MFAKGLKATFNYADFLVESIENNFIQLPQEMVKFRMFPSGEPGNLKFHVAGLKEGYHLTLHFGEHSKIFDIHLTREKKGEKEKKHVPFFKMRHFTLARILYIVDTLAKFATYQYLLKNRINLGKLVHNRCVLHKLLIDEDDHKDFCKITTKKKKTKFQFLDKINKDALRKLYIEPSDIYGTKCEFFQVYKYRRNSFKKVGYLFHISNNNSFYLVAKREWSLYNAFMELGIAIALKTVEFERKKAIIRFIDAGINRKYNGTNLLKNVYSDLTKATRLK